MKENPTSWKPWKYDFWVEHTMWSHLPGDEAKGPRARGIIFGIALTVVALAAGITSCTVTFSSKSCERFGDLNGTESSYSIFGGCYIEVGGKMVPYQQAKVILLGDINQIGEATRD